MNDPRATLGANFGRFDFLQLIRVLLRPGQPGAPARPPDDVVRFRADLSAAFPGRNASAVDARDTGLVEISTPDFCVGSVLGPLPPAFLDWMRDLDRMGATGMRDFLDLFNHRINVLRYRVRAEFEPGLNNDAPARTREAQWLGAIMGVGGAAEASQIPLPERQWLGIGELLANGRRSAAGVVQVLATYLECRVRLEPLVPRWRPTGGSNHHLLGTRRLGEDTLLGRSLWDIQSAVRLHAGPIGYETMVKLLAPLAPATAQGSRAPRGSARALQRDWREDQRLLAAGRKPATPPPLPHTVLLALVRLMLDRRHDAELLLHVREQGIPPSQLTAHPPHTQAGLRLGQTAWLKSRSRAGHLHRGPRARVRSVRLDIPAVEPESS